MKIFSIKVKHIIKKPIVWIGTLTCFLLINSCTLKGDSRINLSKINSHYSSMNLSIKPQNIYREKYDLLIKEFQKLNKINTIAKIRGGILFGIQCEIIGNYFTTSKLNGKYAKTETNADGIQFPFPINHTYDKELFDLSYIEKKEDFKSIDLYELFRLMRKLDIKWISHDKNFIEFSSYVYPANESLDYYNGYIYCLNDSLPNINRNVYYLLYRLENNWYYFVRETYKGPVIYRSYPETDEDYQYLDNLKKTNN